MRALVIELRKEKRTGVIPVLLAVGMLGAAYAFVNFLGSQLFAAITDRETAI